MVTATAPDVLKGKVIVNADGNAITGTMQNISSKEMAKSISFGSDNKLYLRMSKGAHITNAESGYPEVAVEFQDKTVTPSTVQQTITPDSGKVLRNVIVNATNGGNTQVFNVNITSNYLSMGQSSEIIELPYIEAIDKFILIIWIRDDSTVMTGTNFYLDHGSLESTEYWGTSDGVGFSTSMYRNGRKIELSFSVDESNFNGAYTDGLIFVIDKIIKY